MYGAFVKRKIAEDLSQRRSLKAAALWGNTNLDQKEKPSLRQDITKNVERPYDEAIANLYRGSVTSEESNYDPDDPFWSAMRRGMKRGT